jgi:hypothetical protein
VRVGAGSKDLSDDHWQPPSLVAVLHLMTIEFVLNMSLLKKSSEFAQGQRLDRAMSTICHKLASASQHELDFCSDAATIVLGICLSELGATWFAQQRVIRLLLIAGSNLMFHSCRDNVSRDPFGSGTTADSPTDPRL